MRSSAHASENVQGSLFMVVAMAGFSVNDTLVKSVGGDLNLGQTLLIRGLFASILVLFLARAMGQWQSPARLARPTVLLRIVGELVATASFITALFNMPIANVTAILQALPLALTAAAALFLGEAVGWRRMIAILVGFAGVLIIVRPGLEGFTPYSALGLVAVAGCVLRDLATRAVPRDIPAMMITLSTAISVTVLGGIIALFEAWNTVSAGELARLFAASLFLIVGYYCVIQAMRIGDIGFVSPFRYSVLLFAILAGIVAFGEFPDRLTLAGSAIIVATGIYTLYRERIVRRQTITPPPYRS